MDDKVKPISETLGKLIFDSKEDILRLWSDRVVSRIKNAENLKRPIIINTLPAYIDSLAEYVSEETHQLGAQEFEVITEEHGGERARLSKYNPSDLIEEYQIFRYTILEILRNKGYKLNDSEWLRINHFIDRSIRNSVTAFQLVQYNLREQFVATLTHDLRNPLGAADMAAEIILDELDNPNEIVLMVSKIRENLKRINRMIQDLLDTAQVGSGEHLRLTIDQHDIYKIIQDIIKELSLIHGRRFNFDSKESITGYWDRDALTRAIENLILNAIKYGDSKAPINIKVEYHFERVIVSIHNIGNPIPIEEQEAIFQAYRRAQAAREGQQKGWGLGLPLVRSVAESHGGSVGVTSTYDGGTTFVIDIPQDSRPYQNSPVSP